MFTIQCGSCRAKLKVAKIELIGQTLACPRCGDMVQVEPPVGWVPPANAPVAETRAEAKPDVAPAQQPVAKRRRDQSAPNAPRPEDLQETLPNVGSLGWGEELKLVDLEPATPADQRPSTDAKPAPQATGKTTRAAGAPSSSSKEKAVPDALLRPENWDSARTRKRRAMLLAVMAAVGLFILFGALGSYWWGQQSKLAELAKAPPQQPANVEGEKTPAETDANPSGPQDKEAEKPTEPVDGTGNQQPSQPNVAPPNENLVEPNPPDDGASDRDPSELDEAANRNDGAPRPPQPDQSPEEMGLGGTEDDGSDGGFEDTMKKIFDDGLTSEWDDPGLRAMTEAGMDPIDDVLRQFAQQQPTRSRSPRVVKPLPRETKTQRGLTDKIAGFRNEQGRVPQLMTIAETLSGLPVWIDIPRFEGQPIPLETPRLMESVQTTIPDLLANQLEPFGFAVEQHAWNPERPDIFGLRVFPRDTDKMSASSYSIDWLAADLAPEARQTELQTVGKFLNDYIAPGQWGDMVGDAETNPEAQRATEKGAWQIRDGKIMVVHYPHVQKQIARLLRQLTLAKSNQGQPLNWPAELLPKAVQESGRMQTVINLQYHQPVPLRDIFQQIFKQSNATVVVDWPSLIAEGWTPDTVVPLVAENQTLVSVLQELCLDMGLSLRYMAPDVVCLLSDSAEAAYADVEVYPVADLCPSAREWPVLGSRLNRLLEQDLNRYPTAYLYFDPDFGSIIARIPQSSHQRLHAYFRAARLP
ncbi:MAG: hypothetical protein JNK57_09095 [Planctomycetaceae bacterium]|nr:hypothetical protein [Planctomycetaceae bacterium]